MKSETTNQNIKNQKKGMPSGIPFIIGNEAAERFSFYGMKAILIVFMVDYLKMDNGTTTEWFHNFGSAVYLLPIFGALLSDLVLGKYRTILWLSLVYCAGHGVLALYETKEGLFWGLTLIAIGAGGIKPCVSAHVGDQFDESNKELIPKVFYYFYFAINFGSFFSTLAIPLMLEHYGPSIAFGLPGALMFFATFVFWLGRNRFVHIPARPKQLIKEISDPKFLKLLLKLGVLYLFVAVFWSLYDQNSSSWVLQASSNFMDKQITIPWITLSKGFHFTQIEILPSQIQAANPIIVMILIPIFSGFIYPKLQKMFDFKALLRVNVGFFITAASFVIVAYIESFVFNGQEISVWWQFLAFLVLTTSEVMVYGTILEYSYSKAPNSLKSIIMGLALFSVSLGNQITSQINHFLVDDLKVEQVSVNGGIYFNSPDNKFQSGDKINISSELGFVKDRAYKEDEPYEKIEGTFLVGDKGNGRYVVWDANRIPFKVKATKTVTFDSGFEYYKLNGPAYFKFFAWLMFITAIIFIPFALKMKTKTYVQEAQV